MNRIVIFVIVTGGEPSRYFGVLRPAASPCTFINRAINRYHVNARADQFELFLLFRCVANVLFMLSVACFSVDGSALCLAGRLLIPHVSAGRGAYV